MRWHRNDSHRRHRIEHGPTRVRHAHVWRRWRNNLRLQLERKLQEELLGVLVPVGPELSLGFLHFPRGHLEGNRLVRFRRKQQVLPLAVWRFDLLLVRRHEPMARNDSVLNLRIVNLEQQRLLVIVGLPLLRHSIAGTTDLDELLRLDPGLLRLHTRGRLLGLLRGTSGQIGLMLLALGVGQIASLIVVQRQTQFALVRTEMVLHKIRVLVQVDRLQGQLAESLPPIPVAFGPGGHPSSAGFATGTVLEIHPGSSAM